MASRSIVVHLRAETAAYEASMARASAATRGVATTAQTTAKAATAANVGLGKSAAATAVGMKAASNSISTVAGQARSSAGSIAALGSGMSVAASKSGQFGSGMKATANSAASVGAATRGASGAVSAFGSGMATAGAAAARSSGGFRSLGGAAAVAGAGAAKASGGLQSIGSAASAAGAGAAHASGGLKQVGGAAAAAGAGAAAAKGGLEGAGSAAQGASVKATAAASGFGQLSGSIKKNKDEWSDLSTKAMIGGAAIVGGLGLATKAAIDWESAWAGVAKTVDGTDAQMAKLEEGLRGLARTLPATHQEIAGVAEAAGQLGVARDDIVKFTEVAIGLGEATNLSAEEAATSLAQFSNIMGTVAREGVAGYEKLGSTLVELGNNGASTEKQIMEMGLRLAGAGNQIGATESDVLALANALSSVGIEAQLGGGAMSRAMLKMNSAVISGGDELKKFAEISGMSASDFAAQWRKDPISATNAFISGLGRIGDSGGDASAALNDVGLAGTQNAQVLLRAAGASDLVTKSLKMGKSAWRENAALAEEVGKRYATAESRIRVSMNQVRDAAIDIGGAVAPAFAKAAEGIAGLVRGFQSLPGPAQKTITGIAGVTGAALLIGGATVKAISGLQTLSDNLKSVGMLGPRAEKGMRGAARGAAVLGKALMLTMAAGSLGELMQDQGSSIGLEKMTERALNGEGAVKSLNQSLKENSASLGLGESDVTSFGEAVRVAMDPSFFNKAQSASDSALRFITIGFADMTTGADESAKAFKAVDDQLSGLVSAGHADVAARMFKQYAKAAKDGGMSMKEFKSRVPGYTEALAAAGNQAKLAGKDNAEMAEKMEDAEQAADDLSDAIKGLGDTLLNQRSAARDYQAALDEATKALDENGATLDINTEKGRANQKALDAIAEAAQESAAAIFENSGSVKKAQGALDRGRDAWMRQAELFGMNKSEAKRLADVLFQMPEEATTDYKAKNADAAKAKAKGVKDSVDGIPKSKRSEIAVLGAQQSKFRVMTLMETITDLSGKEVSVTEAGADIANGRVIKLDGSLLGLPKKKKVTVTEIGTTAAGERVVKFGDKVYAIPKERKTKVTEHGSSAAKKRVGGLIDEISSLFPRDVKVTESGATPAKKRVRGLWDQISDLFPKTVDVNERGADPSRSRVKGLDDTIRGTDGKNVDVIADTFGKGGVDSLVNSVGRLHDKQITITTVTRQIKKMFADGGIEENGPGGLHSYMASGGTRSFSGQSPHIRRAGGAGVTWAEQGAGPWEAWISGHPAKRDRSLAILDDVAARFGRAVVEPSRFADGGTWESYRNFQTAAPPPVVVRESGGGSQYAGPTAGDMEAAIVRAFSGVTVNTRIGDRDFVGVISRAQTRQKGR